MAMVKMNEWMVPPKSQKTKLENFCFQLLFINWNPKFFSLAFFSLVLAHLFQDDEVRRRKSGKKRMLFWLFLNYSFVCLFAISISLLDFFCVRRFVIEHYRLIFLSIFVAIVVQVVVANFNLQVIFFL